MQLYIANCTKQHQQFLYRVPGESRSSPYMQEIGVGKSIRIYQDADKDTLDAIIGQHADYGLVRVDEIDRSKHFIGMCYQFDREINVDSIIRALDINDVVLNERGAELRKQAAVAISERADQEALESGGSVQALEVSVEEVPVPGGKDTKINETIAIEKPSNKRKKN